MLPFPFRISTILSGCLSLIHLIVSTTVAYTTPSTVLVSQVRDIYLVLSSSLWVAPVTRWVCCDVCD